MSPDIHGVVMNLDLNLLTEAENNPNVMAKRDFEQLVENIRELGFVQPILAYKPNAESPEYRIIDGHHRARAAKKIGMKSISTVIVESDRAGEALMRIAMNRLRGELDLSKAGAILNELHVAGLGLSDLALSGFSETEMADLFKAHASNIDEAVATMSTPQIDYEVEDEVAKPLVLELKFSNADDLKKAKRALKRAAGKGKDMAVGLMRLIGEEAEESEAA